MILAESGLVFRSDREFLKLTGEARSYRRLGWWNVLAVRVSGGLIRKLGRTREVPNFERFFGGGMHSVRGWGLNQLSPRDPEGRVVGGQSRLEATVELRSRLLPFLGTALFLDAGNVGFGLNAFSISELNWAAGAGIRYLSPIGPLRMDVGYRLSDDPYVGRRQIHISLGQAF